MVFCDAGKKNKAERRVGKIKDARQPKYIMEDDDMAKDVTMRDIAKKMGVSTVTVSKALNNKEGVGNTLRTSIRKKAEEMGYKFTLANKALREDASKTVGVLVDALYVVINKMKNTSPFYLRMYQNVVLALSEYGYSAILEVITDEMIDRQKLPKVLSDNKIDSLVVMGPIRGNYAELLKNNGLPVVYLDFYDEDGETPCVVTDNTYGVYMLTKYLIDNGHRKIAFVGSIDATPSILDRYLGYCRALLANHIVPQETYLIPDRGDDGLFIEFVLPDKEQMPTAFVCNCDDAGYVLMERLRQEGYRIPEDISVVGFDNYTFLNFAYPRLTTIEVDVVEMADRAVDLLVGMMRGEDRAGSRIVVNGRFISGNSVAERKM